MNNIKEVMKLSLPPGAKINKVTVTAAQMRPRCMISWPQEAILWVQQKAGDFQGILTEAVLQACEVDKEKCAKAEHMVAALCDLGKCKAPPEFLSTPGERFGRLPRICTSG